MRGTDDGYEVLRALLPTARRMACLPEEEAEED